MVIKRFNKLVSFGRHGRLRFKRLIHFGLKLGVVESLFFWLGGLEFSGVNMNGLGVVSIQFGRVGISRMRLNKSGTIGMRLRRFRINRIGIKGLLPNLGKLRESRLSGSRISGSRLDRLWLGRVGVHGCEINRIGLGYSLDRSFGVNGFKLLLQRVGVRGLEINRTGFRDLWVGGFRLHEFRHRRFRHRLVAFQELSLLRSVCRLIHHSSVIWEVRFWSWIHILMRLRHTRV